MVVADNRPVIEDGLSLALHCIGKSRRRTVKRVTGGEGISLRYGKRQRNQHRHEVLIPFADLIG